MLSLCSSVELLEKARERERGRERESELHIIVGSVVGSFETPYLFLSMSLLVDEWDSLHAVRGQLRWARGPCGCPFTWISPRKNIGYWTYWTGLFSLFDMFFLFFWSRVSRDLFILLEIQSLVMCVWISNLGLAMTKIQSGMCPWDCIILSTNPEATDWLVPWTRFKQQEWRIRDCFDLLYKKPFNEHTTHDDLPFRRTRGRLGCPTLLNQFKPMIGLVFSNNPPMVFRRFLQWMVFMATPGWP